MCRIRPERRPPWAVDSKALIESTLTKAIQHRGRPSILTSVRCHFERLGPLTQCPSHLRAEGLDAGVGVFGGYPQPACVGRPVHKNLLVDRSLDVGILEECRAANASALTS